MAGLSLAGCIVALGQGFRVESVRFGPVAVHDHLQFDYHIPIKGDPFPHEVREGYGYDGVDLELRVDLRWRGVALWTGLRGIPHSRLHFDYDQDTDFEPGTNATHGNEGYARSRSVALEQGMALWTGKSGMRADAVLGWDRQWTRYHTVTTYDLNTNPALPSKFVQRDISERAVVYELRPAFRVAQRNRYGGWETDAWAEGVPLELMLLRNYIPVVLAATSSEGYGGAAGLSVEHGWGAWRFGLAGSAGLERAWHWREMYRRQRFLLELRIAPPKFW